MTKKFIFHNENVNRIANKHYDLRYTVSSLNLMLLILASYLYSKFANGIAIATYLLNMYIQD